MENEKTYYTAPEAGRVFANTMYQECDHKGCMSECSKFKFSHRDESGFRMYVKV